MRPTHRPPLLRKSDGFRRQKLMVLPESLLMEAVASPVTSGLYVTDIGYFHEAEHHYRDRPEGCDSHILMYCTEGSGWYELEQGKTCKVQPGNLIILPAHVPHIYGANTEEPWSIYWFHLRGEHAHAYIESLISQQITTMPPSKAQRWLELFHECYGALETGYSLQTMTFASQIIGYMLGLLAYGSYASATDNGVMTSKQAAEYSVQYMLEHLESGVTLKELAAHARLSVPHYSQVFKQVTGHSPIDYFLRLKIQHSCRYLDFTDWTIKQISSELGFSDPYYFSRLFSKMMGQSPTDYRNQSKG
ncbi:AraC family transcriptional regulator [Paenibacillus sp. RRE4]|uniref:AraC family transcriptional regulator n=1 Tax=Paenibacillus sp. RRE4 TaxID=2962587 RepID=UPI002882711A|nr:AraC family transcriptional regulator [Paenibacillus sp. RRE4]MDT0125137.1 AraC family transcriptional regulator [Paenibacillus sp. RRE4]